jgi:hypothetical protein
MIHPFWSQVDVVEEAIGPLGAKASGTKKYALSLSVMKGLKHKLGSGKCKFW